MHRRSPAPRACAVAVVFSAVLGLPVGAASAGSLVPGGRWTTTVDLPDAWAGQADRLGVSVAELRQQENGCTPPEVRAGDLTCGAEQGELAGQVAATVAAGRWAGGVCAVVTPAEPLALGAASTTRLTVTGPECLVLALDFPDGADDDLAQSDSLEVVLSLVAAGAGATGAGSTTDGAEVAAAGSGSGGVGADPAGTVGRVGPTGAGDDAVGGGAVGGGAPGSGLGPAPSDASGAPVRRPREPGEIGSTTADVAVGTGSTTETVAERSLLGDPFALGAFLLGTTVLLWLLFLVLRRRRGQH